MNARSDRAALDFQQVYDDYHVRIRRYLARLTRPADADDLTQETFVRVNEGLAGFRGEASLSTWIYRIATNVAYDRARRRGFQLEARTTEPDALSTLSTMPVIDVEVARQEMGECVRDYVNQLPPESRAVVVLSEFEDLPDREIAEVLGISVEAAKVRLHRARARLRDLLRKGCQLSRDERNELTCEPRPDDVSGAAREESPPRPRPR